MIKVCFLSTKGNFDNSIGKGTQRYIYELWAKMPKQAKLHNIKLIKAAPGFGKSELLYKTTFTIATPVMPFWDYDIIHLPAPIVLPPLFRGSAAIVTTATEFVKVPKGSPYEVATRPQAAKTGSKLYGLVSKSAIKQALSSDYLITISSLVKEEAISEGFDPKKIYVVNLGVDARFGSLKAKKKSKLFTLGYLGALNARKNVGFAIDSFRKTKAKDAQFKIYGRGPEYDYLVKLASNDMRIHFMNFAPEEKIVDIYDGFDAFIFPSLYEGFGLPILEAQARGIPVIIFKDSVMPKEIKKYCMIAKNTADAARIIEDLRKNGYSKKMKNKATTYARSFTWERCARQTLKVYQDIYSKRQS